jgi:hypothetical protein
MHNACIALMAPDRLTAKDVVDLVCMQGSLATAGLAVGGAFWIDPIRMQIYHALPDLACCCAAVPMERAGRMIGRTLPPFLDDPPLAGVLVSRNSNDPKALK